MKLQKDHPLRDCAWIAPHYPCASPVFVKRFFLERPAKNARLFVTGLGYFEARINERPLSHDRLIPPASDYTKRDLTSFLYPLPDVLTHRIYYHSYEVSEFLTAGENLLEIQCGGGWFVQSERIAEGKAGYSDRPQCIYALVLDDAVLRSNGSEVWHESQIRESELFLGEVIDANFQDPDLKPVTVLAAPDSILSEADGVADRIIREIKPKLLSQADGVRIYDIGENVSALASITTHAPKGSKYLLRFAELLDENGGLNFSSTGASYKGASGRRQIMQDTFITDGSTRSFLPKFVWHAFRYLELSGDLNALDDVRVYVIHADLPLTCEFESDSEALNFLFDAYVRTQLSNYHGSFPSDCPHRERLGYTGDGQICAQTAMLMFDARALYRKWIRDITDSQDRLSGHVQHTAPFNGGGGGPGGWGSAVVTVPYAYYRQYGDETMVRETIGPMKRFLSFTASCMEQGLVVREREKGWCLGDWCMLESAKLPESFVNTCWFIHALRLYQEMNREVLAACDPEAKKWEEQALQGVRAEYPKLKHIGAANMYAAWIGLDCIDACADYYERLGSFDTGFLGTDLLCQLLFQHHREALAYRLLSSEKPGSFLYMKRNGATTLWEEWENNRRSNSHPMFGACCRQLFQGILGICQNEGSVAYQKVTIAPYLPQGVNFARGSIMTPKGKICVSLRREGKEITVTTQIPDGVEALIQKSNGDSL